MFQLTEDVTRRCFITGYAKAFMMYLEWMAAVYCPPECNYIDEATLEFVKNDKAPNFKSQAAKRLFERDIHDQISLDVVFVYVDAEQYAVDFCDDFMYKIQTDWKAEFDACCEILMK